MDSLIIFCVRIPAEVSQSIGIIMAISLKVNIDTGQENEEKEWLVKNTKILRLS